MKNKPTTPPPNPDPFHDAHLLPWLRIVIALYFARFVYVWAHTRYDEQLHHYLPGRISSIEALLWLPILGLAALWFSLEAERLLHLRVSRQPDA